MRLAEAKCVVVLWSRHSVDPEWVRNEATAALERGLMMPATLDGVAPPLAFRRRQTADLKEWGGDPDHPGFRALCDGVAAAIGAKAPAPYSARVETAPLGLARGFPWPRRPAFWRWSVLPTTRGRAARADRARSKARRRVRVQGRTASSVRHFCHADPDQRPQSQGVRAPGGRSVDNRHVSLGTFHPENNKVFKTEGWQEFRFPAVTARYLKVRLISNFEDVV